MVGAFFGFLCAVLFVVSFLIDDLLDEIDVWRYKKKCQSCRPKSGKGSKELYLPPAYQHVSTDELMNMPTDGQMH